MTNYFKRIQILLGLLTIFGLFYPGISLAQKVDLQYLLEEMASRETVARYPDPSFTLGQASSYDRRSVAPEQEGWYGNKDNANFIRVETNQGRKEFVMLNEDGPGAIVRFWMTFGGPSSGEGTLRFYVDGSDTPVIEGNPRMILGGASLVGYPLSGSEPQQAVFKRRGYNLYLPVPYSKSCKITYESDLVYPDDPKKSEAVFYNINYRTFEKDTEVVSFEPEQLNGLKKVLEKTKEALHTQPYQPAAGTEFQSTSDVSLDREETFSVELEGPGAINKLTLKMDAEDLDQALRSTVLIMSFDDKSTVWCPVGDFFGTGYHLRVVRNWYTQVDETGWMTCYWVMPFQKNATIELVNLGDQDVEVEKLEVARQPWQWDNRSMYFGASWQQYSSLYTSRDNEHFDVNYTELQGQGVYVGDVLTLFNTLNGWWGEGDEKIYVDGEDFPSHFGTGTEDYYGYAWSRWENYFSHPYIGQPDGSGNMKPGYVVNLRFRGLDAIPFQESLTVDMEMWHWFKHTRIHYAPACFFYLRPDAKCLLPPDEENARLEIPYHRSDIYDQTIVDGRMEVENTLVLKNTSEEVIYQYNEKFGLSRNTQLLWGADEPGEELLLAFESGNAGKTKVYAHMAKAPDYGKFELYLNGEKAMHSWDGYQKDGVIVQEVLLGEFMLKSGQNTLRIKFLEPAPGLDRGLIGVDYLRFESLN